MMKKYNFIFAFLLLFAISSCQDLNLVPEDSIPEPEFWKTSNDFRMGANAFYGYLDSFHGSDNHASYDLKADLATSFYGFNNISNGRWLPSEEDGVWNNSYAQLRQINKLIQKADELDTSDEGILRYRSEALFFRAYVNFNLLKKFGDVPLINNVLDVNSPELTMPRTPRAEVEDAIIEDLTDALKFLPHKKDLEDLETGRITWSAAMAFRARVALFVGTWGQNHKHRNDFSEFLKLAKESAFEVMNSPDNYKLYKIEGNPQDSYRKLFLEDGDNSSESILDRKYGKDVGPATTHPISDDASAGYLGGATKKFADMFLDSKGLPINHAESLFEGYGTVESEFENRDPRMTATLQVPGRKYIYASTHGKYEEAPINFKGISSTKTGYRVWKYISELPGIFHGLAYFDAKLLRYAEVLLIYAESTFELDGKISDSDLDLSINKIRSRVDMPKLTNVFVEQHNLNMRDEIRRERTIELSFESFRYDDLRRWKTAELELPKPLKGVYFASYSEHNEEIDPQLDSDGFVLVESGRKFSSPKDYLAPLPTKQILMSGGIITQNPGWSY